MDIEQAMETKLDLTSRIQSIDGQLSERRAALATESFSSDEYKKYLEWRTKACRAKATLVNKLGRLKLDIQKMNIETYKNRKNGEKLLDELYDLTKSLVAAGADISATEELVLHDVSIYLAERQDKNVISG